MTTSRARRIELVGLAMLVIACPRPPAPDRRLTGRAAAAAGLPPLFVGRALGVPASLDQIFPLRLRSPSLVEKLRNIYNDIHPEKSLFVHDCTDDWCVDEFYSFSKWLDVAAAIASPGDPAAAARAWKQSVRETLNQPEYEPLIVQAVVNRLDLMSTASFGGCRGPELHLVYAPADPTVKFRLILEFVLRQEQVPTAAAGWRDLSTTGDFAAGLRSLLFSFQAAGFDCARIRTNSSFGGSGEWFLAQWDFSATRSPDRPTPLTDQVRPTCLNVVPGPGCAPYLTLWNTLAHDIDPHALPSFVRIPEEVWSDPQSYSKTGGSPLPDPPISLPIPKGVAHPTDAARDVIALQQCIFCHGPETNTGFFHVDSRPSPRDTSALSCFLTGKDGLTHPTFEQLADPKATGCEARFHFDAHEAPTCASGAVTPCAPGVNEEIRSFHDLSRRALFLATVLLAQDSNREVLLKEFRQALLRVYGTGMAH